MLAVVLVLLHVEEEEEMELQGVDGPRTEGRKRTFDPILTLLPLKKGRFFAK